VHDRCHLYGQCIGGSFILNLIKARPERVQSAVLAQPIGRVGAMAPGRPARFNAWAETLEDHPEVTEPVLRAFCRNLYASGFVYCVAGEFCRTVRTPCLVLAANDEAHPYPISDKLSKLIPHCEFIPEWKSGPALTSAKARVKEFLTNTRQHGTSALYPNCHNKLHWRDGGGLGGGDDTTAGGPQRRTTDPAKPGFVP
jgi:hypothetical protein